MFARSTRFAAALAAAALPAAAPAIAGPAFPGLALATSEAGALSTPIGLAGFGAAAPTGRSPFDLQADFSAPAHADTPPLRAASPGWDMPSPRPSMAAKRAEFEGESRPQLSFETRYGRHPGRDRRADGDL